MANPNPVGGLGGPGHTKGTAFNTTNSPSRTRWKWELAIRFMLKNPNAKQTEVAQHIGVTVVTLSQWMAQPDFADLRNQIIHGVLSHVDEELAEDLTEQRLTLKRAVPLALQNLVDLALQQSNPAIKLKATQEILDREGNHARVTRVGLPTEAQGGIASHVDNEIALKLAEALKLISEQKKQEPPTIDSPAAGGTQ